jgi:hypothetical protein
MKTIFLTLIFGFFGLTSYAQNLIALESGATTTFYSNLEAAITASVNGDIVYLPGGSFTPAGGELSIDKNIDIFGAGHYPDSSLATSQTIINGTIRIKTGADGGSIQGLFITGSVFFGSDASNKVVDGYSISRCYIEGNLSLSYTTAQSPTATQNINISENVFIGFVWLAEATNINISKNIFQSYVRKTISQTIFSNNVFLLYATGGCSSTPTFHDINGAVFNNNIVLNVGCTGLVAGTFTGNSFNHNLFSTSVIFPWSGNPGTGNIVNQSLASIFVNQPSAIFDYSNDLHLVPLSPGENAGTDGTDIGLYGTSFPYKNGAVPANPHISTKVIAPQANSQGELNINITVGAQEY